MSVFLLCRPSVCPSAWHNSDPTGRIFIKYGISGFFEKLSGKFKCHQNLKIIRGALEEDLCTLTRVSRSVLFRVRSVSEYSCTEYQFTHFMFSAFFP